MRGLPRWSWRRAVAWYALSGGFSILWVLVPIAAFVALMAAHERLLRQLERQRRAQRFFDRGLARLRGEWAGDGETGERYLNTAHPYAPDLDLFGKASLFELLSTARTHIGEDTLAGWLQQPAPSAIGWRDRRRWTSCAPGSICGSGWRWWRKRRGRAWTRWPWRIGAKRRRNWRAPDCARPYGVSASWAWRQWQRGAPRWQASFGLAERMAMMGRDFFLLALLVNGIFFYRIRRRMEAVVAAVDEAAHELRLLSEILLLLEAETFGAPLLAELRSSLGYGWRAAIAAPGTVGADRMTASIHARTSSFALTEPFILWTPYWAIQAENWRRQSGAVVRRWLTAMGEMEALSSLASHAFEHPGDPFPEFVGKGPWLEAEGIAHPLIAEDRAVRNDVRLGGELRVLIVSGSNMSGKSTLLAHAWEATWRWRRRARRCGRGGCGFRRWRWAHRFA